MNYSVVLPFPTVTNKGWKWANRLRGFLHSRILMKFSRFYCRIFSLRREDGIYPLPFNLLLKFTDGTREEEALAMISARAIGLPAPRCWSYGDHGEGLPGSILMTRIPGVTLDTVIDSLSPSDLSTIAVELDNMIRRMRAFVNPYGGRICGIDGGAIRSVRVPGQVAGPSPDIHTFYRELLVPAVPTWWEGKEDQFRRHMSNYERLFKTPHAIVFTHGDLMDHNIMVRDGHITGIIDWEAAGWLPEYWEFTTALRGPRWYEEPPWRPFLRSLPSYRYDMEYDCEWSLWQLTQDSWGF